MFVKTWTGVPIISANMDTVGTFEMCKALGIHQRDEGKALTQPARCIKYALCGSCPQADYCSAQALHCARVDGIRQLLYVYMCVYAFIYRRAYTNTTHW